MCPVVHAGKEARQPKQRAGVCSSHPSIRNVPSSSGAAKASWIQTLPFPSGPQRRLRCWDGAGDCSVVTSDAFMKC